MVLMLFLLAPTKGKKLFDRARGEPRRLVAVCSEAPRLGSCEVWRCAGNHDKVTKLCMLVVLQSRCGRFRRIQRPRGCQCHYDAISVGPWRCKIIADLVVGNVYPLGGVTEHTEALIGEELKAVLGNRIGNVSVKAYRVSVQRGHLIDVRVKTGCAVNDVEEVYAALEKFDPLKHLTLPTVPKTPLECIRDGGCPRPKSHHSRHG